VITGPSGVGKGTLISAVRDLVPELELSTSATTRARRTGEVDGVDYHFMTREEFLAKRADRGFLEANEVHGNWYGSPRDPVRDALVAGRDVILKIDVQGAQVVKEQVTEALLIFIIPPSLETLFDRLKSRATETADELEQRQADAAIELARQEDYDYIVPNETGQVERTAEMIEAIVATEHSRHPTRRVRI